MKGLNYVSSFCKSKINFVIRIKILESEFESRFKSEAKLKYCKKGSGLFFGPRLFPPIRSYFGAATQNGDVLHSQWPISSWPKFKLIPKESGSGELTLTIQSQVRSIVIFTLEICDGIFSWTHNVWNILHRQKKITYQLKSVNLDESQKSSAKEFLSERRTKYFSSRNLLLAHNSGATAFEILAYPEWN